MPRQGKVLPVIRNLGFVPWTTGLLPVLLRIDAGENVGRHAAAWIARPKDPDHHVFAIILREGGDLVGAIGLEAKPDHGRAEIGYWVGVPYWNRGYVTEAARAVLGFGFESLGLHRIFAMHFTRNPASGRVMQKLGMKHEGTLREHEKKWDVFVDCEVYGILHSEWS